MKELQILNEVGCYSALDEEIGNEITSQGTGKYVADKKEKEKRKGEK